jgi:hypothetical protein
MKCTHLVSMAVLALGIVGVFGCERDQDKDKPGTTRTTGGTPPTSEPVDRSTTAQPPAVTPRSDETATPAPTSATGKGMEKKDAGHKMTPREKQEMQKGKTGAPKSDQPKIDDRDMDDSDKSGTGP